MQKIRFGTGGFRGVIGQEFTVEAVQRIAQGLSDMMKAEGAAGPVPIGFDNRFLSDLFARRMAKCWRGTGSSACCMKAPCPRPWSCAPCATKAVRTGS